MYGQEGTAEKFPGGGVPWKFSHIILENNKKQNFKGGVFFRNVQNFLGSIKKTPTPWGFFQRFHSTLEHLALKI